MKWIFFSPLLGGGQTEFRVQSQFMWTDCDGDDEGQIVFVKVTELVLLVARAIPSICSSSCAVCLYRKMCCFHLSMNYTCGQQELFLSALPAGKKPQKFSVKPPKIN